MDRLNSKSRLAQMTSKSNHGSRKNRSPLNSQLELNSLESRVVPCSTSWHGTICAPVSSQCGQSEGSQGQGECNNHQQSGGICSHGQNGQGQGGGTTTGQSSTVTISGVVYADGGGTGVYSSSDTVLAGSTVTL